MTKVISLLILLLFNSRLISATEYHVSVKGSNSNNGSAAQPFKTISAAVKVTFPGDTITVHAGTNREWINPLRD